MIALLFLISFSSLTQTPTTVEVTDTVLQENVSRFGVNLGHTVNWEASVLNANIISNPGFEPGHFASGIDDRAAVAPIKLASFGWWALQGLNL